MIRRQLGLGSWPSRERGIVTYLSPCCRMRGMRKCSQKTWDGPVTPGGWPGTVGLGRGAGLLCLSPLPPVAISIFLHLLTPALTLGS